MPDLLATPQGIEGTDTEIRTDWMGRTKDDKISISTGCGSWNVSDDWVTEEQRSEVFICSSSSGKCVGWFPKWRLCVHGSSISIEFISGDINRNRAARFICKLCVHVTAQGEQCMNKTAALKGMIQEGKPSVWTAPIFFPDPIVTLGNNARIEIMAKLRVGPVIPSPSEQKMSTPKQITTLLITLNHLCDTSEECSELPLWGLFHTPGKDKCEPEKPYMQNQTSVREPERVENTDDNTENSSQPEEHIHSRYSWCTPVTLEGDRSVSDMVEYPMLPFRIISPNGVNRSWTARIGKKLSETELREPIGRAHYLRPPENRLFLLDPTSGHVISLSEEDSGDVVFLKCYDPDNRTTKVIGAIILSLKSTLFSQLMKQISVFIGKKNFSIAHEIEPLNIKPLLNSEESLDDLGLKHGDIIIIIVGKEIDLIEANPARWIQPQAFQVKVNILPFSEAGPSWYARGMDALIMTIPGQVSFVCERQMSLVELLKKTKEKLTEMGIWPALEPPRVNWGTLKYSSWKYAGR